MAQETIIDLNNHLIKCRSCLKEFDEEDIQIKITKIIEERYYNFTNLKLKLIQSYSQVICESCNNELRNFALLRKDLILKQLSLIQFVEGDEELHIGEDEPKFVKNEALNESTQIKFEQSTSVEIENFVNTEYLENIEILEDEPAGDDQLCTISFENVPTVKHQSSSRSKKMYKRALCGLCGNSYYKDQLQRHIDKVHYKVKRYFCDLCGFGSFLKCNLRIHMAKHIPKEFRMQIKCELCDSTFTRHESLKNHIKTEHETPDMLKCFCGKEFNLRHKLTTHIKRTHNNVRDHQCPVKSCEKRFFTPKELKIHTLKKHTVGYVDKTEHFCEICGKKYGGSKSLRMHMKHHVEPQFKCMFEGCQKGFITKLLLSNHQKIHLGQRDFMCHLCEKSFFSANHLKRHILVSHEKIRINCFVEGCRFAVGRKDYLRNHIVSHRELPEDVKKEYLIKIRNLKI